MLCQFTVGERIGSGSFGTVYHTRLLGREGLFAVKVIDFYATGHVHIHKFHNRVYTEIDLLQIGVTNPRVCTIVGAVFASIHKVYIVMKLYQYSLASYVRQVNTNITLSEREHLALQCVDILQMLHKFLKVIHGDIKMDNLLVHTESSVTTLALADFGNSISTHHGSYLGYNPDRSVRVDEKGRNIVWNRKSYHCNGKAGTSNRDLSVDLFAMMFVIMELVIGREGSYDLARKRKTVSVSTGISITLLFPSGEATLPTTINS